MNSNSLVWQPVPALGMRFAIESDDALVLTAARQLFAPWIVEANSEPVTKSWRLRRDTNGWRFNDQTYALENALAHIEYGAIGHLAAHLPPAFIGLHGALLSRDFDGKARGVLVVGPKEAGKSTLACALWRAGWHLHCDDFALLDASSHAHPTARRVSLRAGSRALLGDLWQQAEKTPNARALGSGLAFHPHELAGAPPFQSAPLELGALIFLNRRGAVAASAQTQRLSGIEAAFALLPYSTLLLEESGMNLTHERADWVVGLAQLAARVESLPIYDLGRATPQAMVSAIESVLK